jgi:hypothetical protein
LLRIDMAVAESENIYDVLGTVLYRTIPVVIAAADEPSTHHQLSDAQSTPLDYETALAMLKAEQNQAHANGNSISGGGGASGLGSTGGGGAGRSSVASAATADGLLPLAAAAPAVGANGVAPSLPPPHQRGGGALNMSARYGQHCGTQCTPVNVSFKGSISSAVGGQSKRNSRLVGFEEAATKVFDSVAARNAYVAKVASARHAAKATMALSSFKKSFNALKGTSAAATAAGAARLAGGQALTVADAMEMLFPISPVDTADPAAANGVHDDVRTTAGRSRRASASASSASTAAGATAFVHDRKRCSTDGATHPQAVDDTPVPRLWRRADVGHVSRLDVVLLYLHLQRRCATESARPRGVVCPNREQLYRDALQELTRQVTLLCPERGVLLDELARSVQQSIDTYDVLLDSASQYAVRKSTERDLHQHLFAEKAELEMEVRRREHRVSEWRAKYAGQQKRLEEQQAADAKLHEQEIAYAKKANMQLVNEVKRLASEAQKAKEN